MTPDENLRRACLLLASRHEQLPDAIVKAAAKFEAYVKSGSTTPPLVKPAADLPMDQVRRSMRLEIQP